MAYNPEDLDLKIQLVHPSLTPLPMIYRHFNILIIMNGSNYKFRAINTIIKFQSYLSIQTSHKLLTHKYNYMYYEI